MALTKSSVQPPGERGGETFSRGMIALKYARPKKVQTQMSLDPKAFFGGKRRCSDVPSGTHSCFATPAYWQRISINPL